MPSSARPKIHKNASFLNFKREFEIGCLGCLSDDSSRQSGRFAQYYEFHDDAEYENGKAMEGMNSFMTRFIIENIDIVQGLCKKRINY